jgi:hypothetical protein
MLIRKRKNLTAQTTTKQEVLKLKEKGEETSRFK